MGLSMSSVPCNTMRYSPVSGLQVSTFARVFTEENTRLLMPTCRVFGDVGHFSKKRKSLYVNLLMISPPPVQFDGLGLSGWLIVVKLGHFHVLLPLAVHDDAVFGGCPTVAPVTFAGRFIPWRNDSLLAVVPDSNAHEWFYECVHGHHSLQD